MKKLLICLSAALIMMSFSKKTLSTIDFIQVYFDSAKGEFVGVENNPAKIKYTICPGSGVPCQFTFTQNGEPHVWSGSKGKGKGDVEVTFQ